MTSGQDQEGQLSLFLRIPAKRKRRLEALARRRRTSMNTLANEAIEAYLLASAKGGKDAPG